MNGSDAAGQDDYSFAGSETSLKRKASALDGRAPPQPRRAEPAVQRLSPYAASHGPAAPPAQRPAFVVGPPPATQQRGPVNSGNVGTTCGVPPEQVNPNAIIVSRRQEGNPVLHHIRSVRWQYGDIVPDYQMGPYTCALFLSLRFHLLKPEYVHHRIKQLQRGYRLRIILCHVDVDDTVEPLSQVTRAALLNDCTLICAFSVQECARYLETFKSYETKPADAIQGRVEEDYMSRLNAALTTMRGVNRTNVLTLGRAFGSVAGIMQASMEELSACPGIGPTKVRRLHDTFHQPFRRSLRQQTAGGAGGQEASTGATAKGAGEERRQTIGAAVANDGIAEIDGGGSGEEVDDSPFAFL